MSACLNPIQLLGVRFENLTTSEAADRIEEFIREGQPRKVLARNAAIRVMEDRDPWLQQVYQASDLVTVDGMAFIYLGRFLGCRFKEMTGGPALWYEILRRAALKGYRVFLLGAREDTLHRATARLQQQYPGLQIVGFQHGYFRSEEEEQIVQAIQGLHPHILMVGMSSPMKEKFLERNLSRLGVPACIGIGGAIDLFAGVSQLAPTWMRRLCLEWLYRAYQEPRRLAKRYLVSNTRFFFLVARELAGRGGHSLKAPNEERIVLTSPEIKISMKKKILVTGAAGYVGSICTETLLDADYEVIAVDNLQAGKREAILPSARFVEVDLSDQVAVHNLFQEERIDAVMHFAALADVTTSVRYPHLFFKNNVSGTLNLLGAMLSSGVKDLIFSSTAAVYGEPQYVPIDENHPKCPVNSYGESKLAIERMLAWYARAYQLRCVSLRYFNAAGATARLGEDRSNESHLIPCLLDVALGKRPEVSIYGNSYSTKDGTCVRDYVHVLDIVSAHLLCLEHLEELGIEAFNVGHGVGYTVQEVLQEAREVTNCPIPARMVAPRPGDPAVLVATPERLSRRLEWQPRRSNLRTIIEDAWAWRLAHPRGYESAMPRELHEAAAAVLHDIGT